MSTTGKCMSMCPKKEFNFRKRHHLMHPLEFPGENVEDYEKLQIASCVKEFRRSAAGENVSDTEGLRPSSVLLQTIEYLFKIILSRKCSFTMKYDFVFDRLRSVRQDAVIQRLEATDPKSQILILQGCVRFYFYAAYETKKNLHNAIDLHINKTHLGDCLRSLLDLYIANNAFSNESEYFQCSSVTAAYILFNIHTADVLNSVLKVYPDLLRTKTPLRDAAIIYFSYHNHNFIRFNKLVQELIEAKAYILLFVLSTWIDEVRINVVKILCNSHNSKVGSFKANDLCKWLLLPSTDDVLRYCANVGLSQNDGNVKFTKVSLPISKTSSQPTGCMILKVLNALQNDDLSDYLLA